MSAIQVNYERCAGLDVHKRTVVACVLTPEGEQVRTFGTMTKDLLALGDWLSERQVTHVAMESTGVYWHPIWNVLEGTLELVLANARHIKAVPGRKTDVKDCAWIAELLRHGLLQPSFVPLRPERQLRELTRYRATLVQQRTAEVNRLQKTLESANIKLAAVASDIMGVSAQAMLAELLAGNTDVATIANLARGRLRDKLPQLEQALVGRFDEHHRFMVAAYLAHIEYLDTAITAAEARIDERLLPCEQAVAQLDTIPGISRVAAQALLAELGTDMSRFPSVWHLASWAKVCPGNHESAGKRTSGSAGKGPRWLRRVLIECARAASLTKNTYLAAQYRRIAARRGKNRAALAVAHTILGIIYYILQRGTTYQELGGNYFDERDREAAIRSALARLARLGVKVTREPTAA